MTQTEMFAQTPAERHAEVVAHHGAAVVKAEAAVIAAGDKLSKARYLLAVAEEAQEKLERAEARGNLSSIGRAFVDPTTGEVEP